MIWMDDFLLGIGRNFIETTIRISEFEWRSRTCFGIESFSPFTFLLNVGGSKVYNVTKYLEDHPGGAEVMLDVSGQNADEFFEDIGHSNEARTELKKYLIGTYKMSEEEIEKLRIAEELRAQQGGNSPIMIILIAVIAIALAYSQGYF